MWILDFADANGLYRSVALTALAARKERPIKLLYGRRRRGAQSVELLEGG